MANESDILSGNTGLPDGSGELLRQLATFKDDLARSQLDSDGRKKVLVGINSLGVQIRDTSGLIADMARVSEELESRNLSDREIEVILDVSKKLVSRRSKNVHVYRVPSAEQVGTPSTTTPKVSKKLDFEHGHFGFIGSLFRDRSWIIQALVGVIVVAAAGGTWLWIGYAAKKQSTQAPEPRTTLQPVSLSYSVNAHLENARANSLTADHADEALNEFNQAIVLLVGSPLSSQEEWLMYARALAERACYHFACGRRVATVDDLEKALELYVTITRHFPSADVAYERMLTINMHNMAYMLSE